MTDNDSQNLTRRRALSGLAALTTATTMSGVGSAAPGRSRAETTTFTVRIENVASLNTYPTAPDPPISTGGAVWITPGAYAIHRGPNPISRRRKPASEGLEAIAESGRAGGTPENDSILTELKKDPKVDAAGAWTPADTVEDPNDPYYGVPGSPPIAPGGAFEFDIEAAPGQKLAFATMFIPSNDAFFAPGNGGIPLFDGQSPVDGSVTDRVALWDAGTEPNEDPTSGSPNQPPRQAVEFGNPDKGPDENGVVRQLRPTDNVGDGYYYPDPSDAIEVTLTPQ